MNIYLIHGDDTESSYVRLQNYIDKGKKNGWEIYYFDENNKNINTMMRSDNLFLSKKLFVIKGYNLIDKNILGLINTNNNDDAIIYHQNVIPSGFIKKLKNIKKNELFKITRSIWKFIDNFYPGNSKNCIYYLNESVKNDPIELVFTILINQLKDMYILSIQPDKLPYPSWRISKLKYQLSKFGKYKINKLIQILSEIDVKVKTSNADLKDELDLLILRKLE